jgi:CBS domain-containing protein
MTTCPFCSFVNIEGVDTCEMCGQALTGLHMNASPSRLEVQLLSDKISSLNPKSPQVVAPKASIREVIDIMVEHSIGCVLVVEDDQIQGVFTERDAILKLNADYQSMLERPVDEFMTPNPQTLAPDAKIAFAIQRMDQGGYRHLPIVDAQGTPVGVISVRDILAYLTGTMTVS